MAWKYQSLFVTPYSHHSNGDVPTGDYRIASPCFAFLPSHELVKIFGCSERIFRS